VFILFGSILCAVFSTWRPANELMNKSIPEISRTI
jgi:hypothetical protein